MAVRAISSGSAVAPLRVEILAYAPTAFFHCLHCEAVFNYVDVGQKVRAEQADVALPDDLQREYATLSAWIRRLVDRHCGRVEVRVVDAASLEGVGKALWYRTRRFPALVINGRAHPIGADFARADEIVEAALRPAPQEQEVVTS